MDEPANYSTLPAKFFTDLKKAIAKGKKITLHQKFGDREVWFNPNEGSLLLFVRSQTPAGDDFFDYEKTIYLN